MTYEGSFAFASLCISAVIIFYYVRLNKVSNSSGSYFLCLVILNAITSFSSLENYIIKSFYGGQPLWLLDTMTYIYFLTHFGMIFFTFLYILNSVISLREVPSWGRFLMFLPAMIEIGIIALNPWHHRIYRYTAEGIYERQQGVITTYITFLIYFFLTMFVVLWFNKRFSAKKRFVVISVLLLGLASVITQFFLPELQVESCCISICALLMFFFIQNPSEQIDPVLEVFSSSAFTEQMKYNILSHKRFDIIQIIISDYDEYERSTSAAHGEVVLKQIAHYLAGISDSSNLYRVKSDSFVLEITEPKAKEVGAMMSEIHRRFDTGVWQGMEGEMTLSVRLMRLVMPDEVKDVQILLGVMQRFAASTFEPKDMVADDFDMQEIARSHRISQSLARTIDRNDYEMRYTAVHSLALGRIVGVEAALRLYDEELGYVYDEEIFNYAQRSGHILQLGEILFERTCQYVASRNLKEQGISFVGVRLLPAMCLQYGLLEKLVGIVKKYHVDPSVIYLQISEYTISQATPAFRENIRSLEAAGIRFCLEDYGSGFTNITSIYELPFKVMKINKSVIRSALRNEKARVTMECTLSLARELSMMTMVEGVDTQEHFELIKAMDCDFVKGKYMTEQLDGDEFMKVLKLSTEMDRKSEVL